jgi:hypothetical protein
MTYRLFCLDGDGECVDERELRAAHDADAITQIQWMEIPFCCELWEQARFVTIVPAHVR